MCQRARFSTEPLWSWARSSADPRPRAMGTQTARSSYGVNRRSRCSSPQRALRRPRPTRRAGGDGRRPGSQRRERLITRAAGQPCCTDADGRRAARTARDRCPASLHATGALIEVTNPRRASRPAGRPTSAVEAQVAAVSPGPAGRDGENHASGSGRACSASPSAAPSCDVASRENDRQDGQAGRALARHRFRPRGMRPTPAR